MIITDTNDRPSIRFIDVVRPYFESHGYVFHKSKKEFHRTFQKGTQSVGFWFLIKPLTSVSLHWTIQFEKLERLYATLEGKPRSYKSVTTVGTDLCNFTRWEENVPHTFPLFDQTSLNYDHLSINLAAKSIINGYEKYTTTYFNQFKDYNDLYSFYTKQGWRQIREIILAKYLSVIDYEQIVQKLQQEVSRRNDVEEQAFFDKVIHFLNTQDLKTWLD